MNKTLKWNFQIINLVYLTFFSIFAEIPVYLPAIKINFSTTSTARKTSLLQIDSFGRTKALEFKTTLFPKFYDIK